LLPLKIIRSRVLVLSIWTERTDISWGVVNETVTDHLVFSLEASTSFSPRASLDRAIMWSDGGVNIGMGTISISESQKKTLTSSDLLQKILSLKWWCFTIGEFTLESSGSQRPCLSSLVPWRWRWSRRTWSNFLGSRT
jgi:hypothetical protein